MPTREQILGILHGELDYRRASRRLGLPAGQVYLIATGLPADASVTSSGGELGRPGVLPSSSQHLVYDQTATENPKTKPSVAGWIRHQAEIDWPMRRAAEARDAVPGERLEPDETDIATVLTRDHDQVTAMLKQLKAIPGVRKGGSARHQSQRESIVDMITVALSRHESSEEEHFWPFVRSLLDGGDVLADTAVDQEQAGKDVLAALGHVSASDEEFDRLAEELDARARAHVAFEDRVLLRVAQTANEDDRRMIGRRVLDAETHAPTRPHPHAPNRPAAAVKVAGAAGSAVDRVRDTVGHRPAERRGRPEHQPDGGDKE